VVGRADTSRAIRGEGQPGGTRTPAGMLALLRAAATAMGWRAAPSLVCAMRYALLQGPGRDPTPSVVGAVCGACCWVQSMGSWVLPNGGWVQSTPGLRGTVQKQVIRAMSHGTDRDGTVIVARWSQEQPVKNAIVSFADHGSNR
jgi:hypothetical protein